jgi:hypothetical protein
MILYNPTYFVTFIFLRLLPSIFHGTDKTTYFNITSVSAALMFLNDNILKMFAITFKFQYLSAKYTNFSHLGCR